MTQQIFVHYDNNNGKEGDSHSPQTKFCWEGVEGFTENAGQMSSGLRATQVVLT